LKAAVLQLDAVNAAIHVEGAAVGLIEFSSPFDGRRMSLLKQLSIQSRSRC